MAPEEKRIITGSWPQLPIDIVDNIIKRLDLPLDVLSFGGVCKTWRYVASGLHMSLLFKLPMHHFVPKRSPLPMLLHPGCEGPDKHQLYSLNEQKIYGGSHLQELSNKWIVSSGSGWLVTIDTTCAEVNLLNPLTGMKVPLPLLSSLLSTAHCYIRKVIVGSYRGTLVIALLSEDKAIHFFRIGDSKLTRIENFPCRVHDVIMLNSKLYAIDVTGVLFQFDIAEPTKAELVLNLSFPFKEGCFLVDLCGELAIFFKMLQLKKVRGKREAAMTGGFKVVMLEGISWVSLENLSHLMVFIGYNHSFSLDSRVYPSCRGNCIYFADYWDDQDGYDRVRGNLKQKLYHDVGVYHMEDGKVEHFENFCNASSPMNFVWFSPSLPTELEVQMIPH